MGSKPINWTDDMKKYIADNYYDITNRELTEKLNEKFGLHISNSAVAAYRKRNGLLRDTDGRFEKGHVPANKGKPMSKELYEKAKPTMFKKGQTPINYRPVGSERVTVDGYVQVKVKDPRTWKLKHRVVWEAVNGPIPENHTLIFLDGDSTNCELSNLKLIKRSELLVMNRHHLFQDSVELNDVASNLAKCIDVRHSVIKKRKKKGKDD